MFLVQDQSFYQVCHTTSFWLVDTFSQGPSVGGVCLFWLVFFFLARFKNTRPMGKASTNLKGKKDLIRNVTPLHFPIALLKYVHVGHRT